MAVHFTHRTPLNVWRKHACAACGAEFHYFDDSYAEGDGVLPWTARWHARRAAARAARDGSQKRACPSCGAIQPEMYAYAAAEGHRRVRFWAGLVVVLGACLSVTEAGGPLSAPAWTYGALVFAAAVHYVAARRAARPTSVGETTLIQPPPADRPVVPFAAEGPATPWAPLFAMLVVGALTFLPEGYRVAAGLPTNPRFSPPVAGATDAVEFGFAESVVCDGHTWRGEPRVALLNPAEVGLTDGLPAVGEPTLPSRSKSAAFDGQVRFDDRDRGKERRVHLTFDVPPDAREGSTMRLRLELEVSRPMRFRDGYRIETDSRVEEAELVLGPRECGALYAFLRRIGLSVAFVGYFVAAALLRRRELAIVRGRASAVVTEAADGE